MSVFLGEVQTTKDLIDLAAEILRLGKRDMGQLLREQIRKNKAAWAAKGGINQNKKYPPEFGRVIALDGEPALFSYDENGAAKSADLVEPFWARLYVESNEIVFVQETGQFKQYEANTGIWEFLAPSTLEDELSTLIRKYAAKVPILADLDNQRSNRLLENLRRQVKGKVTVPNSFQKECKFVHLKNTMLVWNDSKLEFEEQPFSKDFYSTARIDVDFNPNAFCPDFLKFLYLSLSPDDVKLLQRWFGLVIFGV